MARCTPGGFVLVLLGAWQFDEASRPAAQPVAASGGRLPRLVMRHAVGGVGRFSWSDAVVLEMVLNVVRIDFERHRGPRAAVLGVRMAHGRVPAWILTGTS
jgi:hypothetical protein